MSSTASSVASIPLRSINENPNPDSHFCLLFAYFSWLIMKDKPPIMKGDNRAPEARSHRGLRQRDLHHLEDLKGIALARKPRAFSFSRLIFFVFAGKSRVIMKPIHPHTGVFEMKDKLAVATYVTAKYGPWVVLTSQAFVITTNLLSKKNS